MKDSLTDAQIVIYRIFKVGRRVSYRQKICWDKVGEYPKGKVGRSYATARKRRYLEKQTGEAQKFDARYRNETVGYVFGYFWASEMSDAMGAVRRSAAHDLEVTWKGAEAGSRTSA